MAKITLDSVFEEIEETKERGKYLRAKSKMNYINQLLQMGKVKQIGKKYFCSAIVPSVDTIYQKIEAAKENGIDLSSMEKAIAEDLVKEGKVKKVYNKFYSDKFAPRTQKDTIEQLMDEGFIKKVRKKYVILGKKIDYLPVKPVQKDIPSFLAFLETFQNLYVHEAQGYQRSVSIIPLINDIINRTNLSRNIIEKWILELPRIFIGSVDLRPFPGEPGLYLEDGTEVNRIYVERELVGL